VQMLCSQKNFCKVTWLCIKPTIKMIKGAVGSSRSDSQAFLISHFFSKRNLEMASYFCDKYFAEELNFSPALNDADIRNLMFDLGFHFYFNTAWRNSGSSQFKSDALKEDGFCLTFNSIRARSIFRNDSVDPEFFENFENKKSANTLSKREPQAWNIETGYTPNRMQYYPLRSLRKGLKNGLGVAIRALTYMLEDIDTTCREDPQSIKIALHHPAEVPLENNFITVQFNQSVQVMIRPKITRTSDSLKSYDPEV
jgi:hypothetical protein